MADPNIPSGGYYIIKNSWGLGCGDNGSGYFYTPWGIPEADGYGQNYAVTGAVYYTGTMYFSGSDYTDPANYHTGTAAIATWTGNGGGVWSSSAANNWTIGGSAFTWVNQEVGAVFDNTSSNRSITISGTAIAHGLTFSPITSGSTYTISGGALTVTAGGITANENVAINTAVAVGAPQSWTVTAGKTMTLGGVHMVISDLTLNGAGTTIINGATDSVGVLVSQGATPGTIIQAGPGALTLNGNAIYAANMNVTGGTLNLAPPSGATSTISGC